MTHRIARPRHPKHSATIMAFNQLLLDLKLQLSGYEAHKSITPERLNELGKMVDDLESCTERVFWDGDRFDRHLKY